MLVFVDLVRFWMVLLMNRRPSPLCLLLLLRTRTHLPPSISLLSLSVSIAINHPAAGIPHSTAASTASSLHRPKTFPLNSPRLLPIHALHPCTNPTVSLSIHLNRHTLNSHWNPNGLSTRVRVFFDEDGISGFEQERNDLLHASVFPEWRRIS